MKWRWTDRVALGCFVAAWLSLMIFHTVPATSRTGVMYEPASTFYGWEIWKDWWQGLKHIDQLEFEWSSASIWAALHLALLLLLSSPLLIPLLRSNRWIWWLFAIMSAMTLVGVTGVLGWVAFEERDSSRDRFEVGFWLLMAAPVIHFIGVLFVRRGRRSGALRAP